MRALRFVQIATPAFRKLAPVSPADALAAGLDALAGLTRFPVAPDSRLIASHPVVPKSTMPAAISRLYSCRSASSHSLRCHLIVRHRLKLTFSDEPGENDAVFVRDCFVRLDLGWADFGAGSGSAKG